MNPDSNDILPIDPDIEVDNIRTRVPRPVHLRWRYIALVFVGGAIGTAARYLISLGIAAWNGLPVATFGINVTGAFVLGLLLESLSRGGPDEGKRRAIRLFAGTGIMGGYTTYSSFAVDTDGLIATAHLGDSVLYALATVLVGAAASVGGIALGAAIHRSRARKGQTR
ncbi:fluoride efflux transporter FluC [Leifsonia aquatica]|uniref:fluoride efflux transporter FluC n=1 Tax=Leifsonia aquatica TaxID=144185 RepID=UPI000A95FDD8|nr:CrcB family protein [Leifsonia aquatica]